MSVENLQDEGVTNEKDVLKQEQHLSDENQQDQKPPVFDIRGLKTIEDVEKALDTKTSDLLTNKKRMKDLKAQLDKFSTDKSSILKENEELRNFKERILEDQKNAELKKLEEEKNYEEIIKRKDSEFNKKLEELNQKISEEAERKAEEKYLLRIREFEAAKKLAKIATEMKFRNVEDVEIRIKPSELVSEDGSFKEVLAKEKLSELAEKRPDLVKQNVIEDSTPPSAMTNTKQSVSGVEDSLPKNKTQLINMPHDKLSEFRKTYPELYDKLMKQIR